MKGTYVVQCEDGAWRDQKCADVRDEAGDKTSACSRYHWGGKVVCIIFEVRGILCNYVFSLLTSSDVQPCQGRKLSKGRKAVTTNIMFDDSLPETNRPGKYSPKSKLSQGTHNKKIYTKQSLFRKQTHMRNCLELQKQNQFHQQHKHHWIKREQWTRTDIGKLEVNMDFILNFCKMCLQNQLCLSSFCLRISL